MVLPRQPAPPLSVCMVEGGPWRLSDQRPETFTMVVFYRGLHCPICARYLQQIETRLPDFARRGVTVVAVSMDGREQAQQAYRGWGLRNLPVGYGLSQEQAEAWGLFFSSARTEKEPPLFSEPGLFLVAPDGVLFFAQAQSAPFTRPDLDALLSGIDFVIAKDYPARGEVDPTAARSQAAA